MGWQTSAAGLWRWTPVQGKMRNLQLINIPITSNTQHNTVDVFSINNKLMNWLNNEDWYCIYYIIFQDWNRTFGGQTISLMQRTNHTVCFLFAYAHLHNLGEECRPGLNTDGTGLHISRCIEWSMSMFKVLKFYCYQQNYIESETIRLNG